MQDRKAKIKRKTGETEVYVELTIDGRGSVTASTGVGFFDHMLDQLGRHAGFDIDLKARGDLAVDDHHTVEDVGICLGRAVKEALGDLSGINRFGYALVPLDEALAMVSLDLSGRGQAFLEISFPTGRIGSFDTDLVAEFLRAFASNGGITLHARILAGQCSHHMAEAVFKGLARALFMAVSRIGEGGVPSTKGILV